jgi:ABC-type glycerol-3-phosphate transport system substrate-binding protein
MRKHLVAIGMFTILAAGCSSAQTTNSTDSTDGPVTLTLLAHESFTPTPGIFDAFTAATGIVVEIVQGGDVKLQHLAHQSMGERKVLCIFC